MTIWLPTYFLWWDDKIVIDWATWNNAAYMYIISGHAAFYQSELKLWYCLGEGFSFTEL